MPWKWAKKSLVNILNFLGLSNIYRTLNVIICSFTRKEWDIKSVMVEKKNLLYNIFIYSLFYKMYLYI
jgi:hypothetical protein